MIKYFLKRRQNELSEFEVKAIHLGVYRLEHTLRKKNFYGLWDLWATGTLKIIGCENSQEATCVAPTGWVQFIQAINFFEKVTESWWKASCSERKAKPNDTKLSYPREK